MEQLSLIQDSIDNLSKHMPEGEYIQLMNATKTIYNTIKKKPKKIIIYRKKTSFAKQIIGPYVYRKFNYNDLITISWKGELYLRDLNYAIYHFKRFIDGALQIGNYIQNNHSFYIEFFDYPMPTQQQVDNVLFPEKSCIKCKSIKLLQHFKLFKNGKFSVTCKLCLQK